MPDDANPLAAAQPEELQEYLAGRIRALRDKLIDISARNPLIAFKHSERAAGYIRVVDERPDDLFQRLQSGEMQFEPLPDPQEQPADEQTADFQIALEAARLTDLDYLAAMQALGEAEADEDEVAAIEEALRGRVRTSLGLPRLRVAGQLNIVEYARAHGINPSFELTMRPDDPAAHLADDKIRALYVKNRLETRLRGIHDKYRAHASESGIHTLYIAFGFIEWPEEAGAAASHHAPLLLMPVHLRRELVRNRYLYRLSGKGEDLSVNIALRELMRRRFGMALPDVDDNQRPESYFAKLAAVLDDSVRLQLRRFVTIGIFPFPRMALWADLDPERWPERCLFNHEQIALLLGARGEERQPGDFPPDYPIDAEAIGQKIPPVILPADVSQHSALVDVVNGKSLAVEGPPGTGKSQTIANMIAATLDRGKRVLFLAEKRAALEVVAKRLKENGFGPLMLELHSEAATRATVVQSLRERINTQPAAAASVIEQQRADLTRQRDTLRRYIGLLRCEVGSLGRPVNTLYWRFMSLDHRLRRSFPFSLRLRTIDEADQISSLELTDRRRAAQRFRAAGPGFRSSSHVDRLCSGETSTHPAEANADP